MKNKTNVIIPGILARKIANRKLVEVSIKSLKVHPLEPPLRLKTDAPKFKELRTSIL
jgi:hypothetical protein